MATYYKPRKRGTSKGSSVMVTPGSVKRGSAPRQFVVQFYVNEGSPNFQDWAKGSLELDFDEAKRVADTLLGLLVKHAVEAPVSKPISSVRRGAVA